MLLHQWNTGVIFVTRVVFDVTQRMGVKSPRNRWRHLAIWPFSPSSWNEAWPSKPRQSWDSSVQYDVQHPVSPSQNWSGRNQFGMARIPTNFWAFDISILLCLVSANQSVFVFWRWQDKAITEKLNRSLVVLLVSSRGVVYILSMFCFHHFATLAGMAFQPPFFQTSFGQTHTHNK